MIDYAPRQMGLRIGDVFQHCLSKFEVYFVRTRAYADEIFSFQVVPFVIREPLIYKYY